MIDRPVLAVLTIAVPAATAAVLLILPRRVVAPAAIVAAALTATAAAGTALAALTDPARPLVNDWIVVDAPAGLMVAVTGGVGLVAVLVSPAYLKSTPDAARHRRHATMYYAVLYAFWAVLLAVPLAGNLAGAWLLIEATTAASALLVGFSRKARALEAGWKYLILTSLGLGVALLGIALLAAGVPGGGLGALPWRALPTYRGGAHDGVVVYVLLLAGLAAKIGWAPVHNWLPDAHSEAPAPVSALLSAALLPTVLVVAWRCEHGLTPVIGAGTAQAVLILFGLASIAVAVPFLARPLVWKRLLAYSSLEHMGVLALGIGLGTPLAVAGVVVHIVAHAIAKTLGFCAGTPLLAHDPTAATTPVTGIARRQPGLGVGITVSMATLAGIPPSPIFASELLIIAGGLQSRWSWPTAIGAALLALAFLAFMRNLLDVTLGGPGTGPSPAAVGRPTGLRGLHVLTAASVVLLLALTGTALWLPATDLVQALAQGVR